MAPQRSRMVLEDSRSEASSSKEKPIVAIPTKTRRSGNITAARTSLKDVTVAQTPVDVETETNDTSGGVRWYPCCWKKYLLDFPDT